MPSCSVLANWVLRFGQVCKEREAKVGACAYAAILRGVMQVRCEAAEEYSVTLMTDMSSKMGQDGKKFQVNSCSVTKAVCSYSIYLLAGNASEHDPN